MEMKSSSLAFAAEYETKLVDANEQYVFVELNL